LERPKLLPQHQIIKTTTELTLTYSSPDRPETSLTSAWFPVIIGLTVIFFESTNTMSGANTGHWLLALCHWLWGQTNEASVALANLVLRKLGHFCGYGTLGLLFYRAWLISLRRRWKGPRSRLPFSAAALAVLCTFAVACADELHQHFLEGRTSSFYDVLLDTAGAILLIRLFTLVLTLRRKRLLETYPV
jgi:VanZ family protein